MSDTGLAPRSPLEGLSLSSGESFALAEAPAAARFVFRGGEDARALCSASFGAELPAKLGLAGERQRRAALWLGPDEWLLIDEGDEAASLGADIEASLAD